MSVILANIGNTNSELAVCDGLALRSVEVCRTHGLLARQLPRLLAENPNVPILAACVVPEVQEIFVKHHLLAVTWLDAGMDVGVDFSAVDASSLGADRVANCVAAAAGELPVVVLDCGTAVTIEVVDSNRRFLGGAILPGRSLARKSLNEGTGLLPMVELTEDAPPAIGLTTVGAIQSGIDLGILGAVERILTETLRQLGGGGTVIAVGGDREFFTRHLEGVAAGPDSFTLQGVSYAARALGLH